MAQGQDGIHLYSYSPRGLLRHSSESDLSRLLKEKDTTIRGNEIDKIAEIENMLESHPEIMSMGPDFLMERLLHGIFEETNGCIHKIKTRLESLEDAIFQRGKQADFEALFQIRNDIVVLGHVIEAELEIFGRLGRGEFKQLCEECLPHMRDIYDHIWRMNMATHRFREWVAGLLSAHQAQLTEKTNEVVKLLTIIATLLLPLSVITGFFGMNFISLPGLRHPLGWFFTTTGMVFLTGAMLLFFKRKKWL